MTAWDRLDRLREFLATLPPACPLFTMWEAKYRELFRKTIRSSTWAS